MCILLMICIIGSAFLLGGLLFSQCLNNFATSCSKRNVHNYLFIFKYNKLTAFWSALFGKLLVMHRSFETPGPPPPPLGFSRAFTFYVSENQ